MKQQKIDGYKVFDFGIPCTIESYNTNNGWGFGGSHGLKYTFNDKLFVKIGKACYRHHPSTPHVTVWYVDDMEYPDTHSRIFGENDTSKNKEKAKVIVENILKENYVPENNL